MKIICDCGNETAFNTIDEDTGFENAIDETNGQYITLKPDTFTLWEQHDVVGIKCDKCDKAFWMFT